MMKTIGLIGGTTWESTKEYYRIINQRVNQRLGGNHSGKIILYSFDFADLEELVEKGDWRTVTKIMIDVAQHLENAGAQLVLLCANTMHKMAEDISVNISVPLLHIVDVTAQAIQQKGLKTVGLLGTKITMQEPFYKKRLKEKFGLNVVIPDKQEREIINDIIFKELSSGQLRASSKDKYLTVMSHLIDKHAEGIILGCTEIPLLIKQDDVDVPVFDTVALHAEAAVNYALR